MPIIIRCWIALASVGAGLVCLAVGASSPLVLQIALVAVGAGQVVWAVLAFARNTLPAPRQALWLMLAPVIGWAMLLVVGIVSGQAVFSWTLPVFPMAVASLLSLAAAAMLTLSRRREDVRRRSDAVWSDSRGPDSRNTDSRNTGDSSQRGHPASGPAGTTRFLVGLAAGSFLVAGLVTPALAATDAGSHAVPHGEHRH
ncbi:hypothetical protein GCM10027416_31130 [Okibacterium endophyticum]